MEVSLKSEAQRGKYGLVTVRNKDGSLNREFKITQEELATLHASGNGLPPNVTREEWTEGRATVFGKDFVVGDVEEKEGFLTIKYAEEFTNGRFVESWLHLKPGEWSGTLPEIDVPLARITEANTKNTTPTETNVRYSTKTLVSIEKGVLTWQ